MKTLTILSALSLSMVTPFLVCCDSGDPNSTGVVGTGAGSRGLDATALAAAPGVIIGFPYALRVGETIEFTSTGTPLVLPLLTFEANAPHLLFQSVLPPTPTDFDIHLGGELEGHRYIYRPEGGVDDPEPLSTKLTAKLVDGGGMAIISPGELAEEVNRIIATEGSLYAAFNNKYSYERFGAPPSPTIDDALDEQIAIAVSSDGWLCIIHPDHGLAVRQSRLIELDSIITSTGDLLADNFIQGSYNLTDIWLPIFPSISGPVDPTSTDPPTFSVTFGTATDTDSGTFRLNVTEL